MNYLDYLNTTNTEYIELEKALYSKNTILKACYKFTDKAYIYIKTKTNLNKDYFVIYFENKSNDKNLIGNFMNELLDQELREIVNLETKKIRETIVTKALIGFNE